MATQKNKEILINLLADLLTREISLSNDVRHYIDSTFAVASIDELIEALMDPDNCEAATAIELIFFPDETTQEQIEPILAKTNITESDEADIIRRLCRQNICAPISFPKRRGKANLPVPESAVRQFIARLHLVRSIPQRLAAIIDECIADAETACRIRVRLRNARIAQSENQVDFLATLIQSLRATSGDDHFWPLLDLAIELLEQTDPAANIYDALMAHKQFLIKSIRATEKNHQALESNTVEALIMKGINISSDSIDAARKKIDRIDRICIAAYGKTEFLSALDPAGQPIDLDVQGKDDIAAILKLLS